MAAEHSEQIRSYSLDVIARLRRLKHCRVLRCGMLRWNTEKYPFVRATTGRGPRTILLAAGVHGSEPAGVFALLDFLEHDAPYWSKLFTFVAFPCINPWGFERHGRTNPQRKDLNYHFGAKTAAPENVMVTRALARGPKHYLAAFDLHESNPESTSEGPKRCNPREFFLFETCPDLRLRIGRTIVNAVKRQSPVCTRSLIWGERNRAGVIWYPDAMRGKKSVEERTLEGHVQKRYTPQALTFETPRCWPLEKRIATHRLALDAALSVLSRRRPA